MKLFIKTLSIIFTTYMLLTPTTVFAEDNKAATAAQMIADNADLKGRLIEVQVNGMVCDFCAQSLTKVLQKKDAVEKVEISLETKLMIITQKQDMVLTDEEVTEAVNWAGYETASIERL